ncbi:MAG: hypothetical protein SFH39_00165 [Candidatus Magnetobacterium sp. LHC-1]
MEKWTYQKKGKGFVLLENGKINGNLVAKDEDKAFEVCMKLNGFDDMYLQIQRPTELQ